MVFHNKIKGVQNLKVSQYYSKWQKLNSAADFSRLANRQK